MKPRYDQAFAELRERVRELQRTHPAWLQDGNTRAAELSAAQAEYWRSRNALADLLMGRPEGAGTCDTERLAYTLWERAGRPSGQAEQFWYEAERMLGECR